LALTKIIKFGFVVFYNATQCNRTEATVVIRVLAGKLRI